MLDLEAIELIKQLKARYFRFLDTADLAGLKSVFTEDAEIHFQSPSYEIHFQGWPDIEQFYRNAFTATSFGMHHGHHPEISVDGDTATGLWYLHDIFVNLDENVQFEGSALYHDTYRQVGGNWKIQRSSYERLLEQVTKRDERTRVTTKPVK